MKKSLIAIAALAAVGAASAQSSVTLYGLLDTNYGWARTKVSVPGATGKVTDTGLNATGGNLSGSRWGLKGQEDLGNGLSAVFNVEAGFDSANGDFSSGFNRRSVVGLQGSFGRVLLGRDYTPMDFVGSGGGFQSSDLVTGNNAGNTLFGGPGLYTNRANGIHYAGNFSNVTVLGFVGYDDNKTETTNTITGVTTVNNQTRAEGYGLGVGYARDAFAIGGAVQYFRDKNTVASVSTDSKRTEYGIGASYNFTSFKLMGHYMANKPSKGKALQQLGLGVDVPFGAFTLGAQYAYNYQSNFMGENDAKGHDFVLQGIYALSKRTDLYARAARYNDWKVKTDAGNYKVNSDVVAVGIRHRF